MSLISLMNVSGEPDRLLTEADVTRAHIAAPHVLAVWQARDAHYWRRSAIGFMIGAAIPVLGYFAWHWPIVTLLLALVLDVLAIWACDALKSLLAARRVQEEVAHIHEAADIMAVMRALQRRRRPGARDLLAPAPEPALYLTPSEPVRDMRRVRVFAAVMVLVAVGLLSALLLHWVEARDRPVLLAGMLLRIGWSALRTVRARRDAGSRPELLAEWVAPTTALWMLAALLTLLYEAGLIPALDPDEPSSISGLVLLLHWTIVAALSSLSLRRVRALVGRLRTFAAQDREQMKQRVRQVNGSLARD